MTQFQKDYLTMLGVGLGIIAACGVMVLMVEYSGPLGMGMLVAIALLVIPFLHAISLKKVRKGWTFHKSEDKE